MYNLSLSHTLTVSHLPDRTSPQVVMAHSELSMPDEHLYHFDALL